MTSPIAASLIMRARFGIANILALKKQKSYVSFTKKLGSFRVQAYHESNQLYAKITDDVDVLAPICGVLTDNPMRRELLKAYPISHSDPRQDDFLIDKSAYSYRFLEDAMQENLEEKITNLFFHYILTELRSNFEAGERRIHLQVDAEILDKLLSRERLVCIPQVFRVAVYFKKIFPSLKRNLALFAREVKAECKISTITRKHDGFHYGPKINVRSWRGVKNSLVEVFSEVFEASACSRRRLVYNEELSKNVFECAHERPRLADFAKAVFNKEGKAYERIYEDKFYHLTKQICFCFKQDVDLDLTDRLFKKALRI